MKRLSATSTDTDAAVGRSDAPLGAWLTPTQIEAVFVTESKQFPDCYVIDKDDFAALKAHALFAVSETLPPLRSHCCAYVCQRHADAIKNAAPVATAPNTHADLVIRLREWAPQAVCSEMTWDINQAADALERTGTPTGDDARVLVASVVNDPSDFSPQEDFNSLEFASYTDAKKAEVLFNRMQRTIDALRHDLERAMANHNADLNGDDARDAARWLTVWHLLHPMRGKWSAICGRYERAGSDWHLKMPKDWPVEVVMTMDELRQLAAMQRTKGSGG